MSRRYSLLIAYDGGAFFGWEDTGPLPTVEKTLKQALEQILQHPLSLEAASRTDRGVHAQGQVISFSTSKELSSPSRYLYSLNALLPPTIRVQSMASVPLDFHPTLSAIDKSYLYQIYSHPTQDPFFRHLEWHFPRLLDLALMQKAARLLMGTHDFSAFCNQRKDLPENKVRTLTRLEVLSPSPHRMTITLEGPQFLYKMARNISGTLVYIGAKKIALEQLPLILEGKDRRLSGITAPAHGLSLQKVRYPSQIFM